MGNLIKFEFRKLFKSKSFYICLAICIGLVLLGGLTTKVIIENVEGEVDLPSKYSMLQSAISSASITLIAGIFTALFVCEDETSGTIKNIYAKGYSRGSVFISKYIASLVAVLIFTFGSMLIAYLFGKLTWPDVTTSINNLFLDIVGQVLLIIAYQSIFFAISSKLGKTGSSIAFNIVGPLLVSMVLTMADAFLKLEDFKLSSYWIDSLLTNLGQTTVTNQNITAAIVMGIIYSIVFVGVGFTLNKKKEI